MSFDYKRNSSRDEDDYELSSSYSKFNDKLNRELVILDNSYSNTHHHPNSNINNSYTLSSSSGGVNNSPENYLTSDTSVNSGNNSLNGKGGDFQNYAQLTEQQLRVRETAVKLNM